MMAPRPALWQIPTAKAFDVCAFMRYFWGMSPVKSKSANSLRPKRYGVLELRGQLKELERHLQGGWTSRPVQPIGPHQSMGRNDVCTAAQSFCRNATQEGATDMQEQDEDGIRAFLETATELLTDDRIPKSVVIGIEPHQEKMEFGPLCAFVLSYLAKLEKNDPQPFP
jgi:hypothetical protein